MVQEKARPPGGRRSGCPIAGTLDLLGDKWTLLVVRDLMFYGKRRFNELQASPEGVPTNILSDRLRRLDDAGLVRKARYQKSPPRYEYLLTPMGSELISVLREIISWGKRYLPDIGTPPPGGFRPPTAENGKKGPQ
jgi:DNA-binding HxlR family transcriptional regulator